MNRRILVVGVVALVAIVLAVVWSQRGRSDPDRLVPYGNVDIREVLLAFRQPGRVLQMDFDEGDAVTAGARMALLDPVPYRDALAAAEASVRVAQAEVDKLHGGLRPQEITQAREALNQARAVAAPRCRARLPAPARSGGFRRDQSAQLRCRPRGARSDRRRRQVGPGGLVAGDRGFPQRGDCRRRGTSGRRRGDPSDKAYLGKVGFISPKAEFTPKTVETPDLRTDLVYRLRVVIDAADSDVGLRQGMPVTVEVEVEAH